MLTAKKINKNVALNKINPNKDEVAINNGNDIKLTLFSLINFAFALFRKNGHVAAKCVSAKNKIVKKIKKISKSGNKYNITPYIKGKIKGNLTRLNSKFIFLFIIIFFSNYNK